MSSWPFLRSNHISAVCNCCRVLAKSDRTSALYVSIGLTTDSYIYSVDPCLTCLLHQIVLFMHPAILLAIVTCSISFSRDIAEIFPDSSFALLLVLWTDTQIFNETFEYE